MRLALGKKVPAGVEPSKAVVAHAAAATAGGDKASRTPEAAAEFTRSHQPMRRLEPEDEGENRSPESAGAGEPLPGTDKARSAPPERRETAARAPSEMATAKAMKEGTRAGAAEAIADAATGAGRKKAPPITEEGSGANSEMSSEAGMPRRKRTRCPVFRCTGKHAPDNCPTFRDMTPKERLDLIHRKQLCLFCLRHLMGKECETMGKWPNCTIDGCGKLHHEMLQEVLKAGKPSAPAKKTEPPNGPPPVVAGGAPALVAYLK